MCCGSSETSVKLVTFPSRKHRPRLWFNSGRTSVMTELGKADGFHELLWDRATYLEIQNIAYVYVCRKAQLFKISILNIYFILVTCEYVSMCTCVWALLETCQKRVSVPGVGITGSHEALDKGAGSRTQTLTRASTESQQHAFALLCHVN